MANLSIKSKLLAMLLGITAVSIAIVATIGYYDLFLIDIETGDIVYTVTKETDFATNLNDGPMVIVMRTISS